MSNIPNWIDGQDALVGNAEARDQLKCPICNESGKKYECCGEE